MTSWLIHSSESGDYLRAWNISACSSVITGGERADLQRSVNTSNSHPLLLRGERMLLQADVLLLQALQPHLEDKSTSGSESWHVLFLSFRNLIMAWSIGSSCSLKPNTDEQFLLCSVISQCWLLLWGRLTERPTITSQKRKNSLRR